MLLMAVLEHGNSNGKALSVLLDGAYLLWTMQTENETVFTHIGQQLDEGYQVAERCGIRGTGYTHIEGSAEQQVEQYIAYLRDEDTSGDEARMAVEDDIRQGHAADYSYKDGKELCMYIGPQHGLQAPISGNHACHLIGKGQ